MSDGPLLEVEDLTKVYGAGGLLGGGRPVRAVDGVSFAVGRREIVGLVGESGSGKSTIARMLMKLETPTSGQILLDGTETGTRGQSLARYRSDVQMVFQDPFASLNARMSAGEIISEPWATHRSLYKTGREREARLR